MDHLCRTEALYIIQTYFVRTTRMAHTYSQLSDSLTISVGKWYILEPTVPNLCRGQRIVSVPVVDPPALNSTKKLSAGIFGELSEDIGKKSAINILWRHSSISSTSKLGDLSVFICPCLLAFRVRTGVIVQVGSDCAIERGSYKSWCHGGKKKTKSKLHDGDCRLLDRRIQTGNIKPVVLFVNEDIRKTHWTRNGFIYSVSFGLDSFFTTR